MDETEQYYLRGQVEAIWLIQKCINERLTTEALDESEFYLILIRAEDEALERLNNPIHYNSRLDFSAHALQWFQEQRISDYEDYLNQLSEIDSIKQRIIYTKEEQDEIDMINKYL